MDAIQFAYWLQGYSEITQGQVPTPAQWQIIQDHLKLVFTKVTPDRTLETLTTAGKNEIVLSSLPSGYVPWQGGQVYC